MESKGYIVADVVDSFVYNKIKSDTTRGNGEGKLYVGTKDDDLNYDVIMDKCTQIIFSKENLIEYMNKTFSTYAYNFFGGYRDADLSYWNEKINEIRQMEEDTFSFNEKCEVFHSGNRIYIRLQNDMFQKIFRRVALPNVTKTKLHYDLENQTLKFELLFRTDVEEEHIKKTYSSIKVTSDELEFPYNRIIYGAPGTGKSYKLNKDKEEGSFNKFERVTFYPNYSYSHFVGVYKPITSATDNEKITYEFVPGPFLRILVEAFNEPTKNHLLLIEEINRANVSSVFGDVFQLLDRDDSGNSVYTISMSEDIKRYLLKQGITSVSELYLPSNLFIWATMNSADQGVYTLDSAFKRRWEFEYININYNYEKIDEIEIDYNGKKTTWNKLRDAINEKLSSHDMRVNEDKLIGPFFLKQNEMKKNFNQIFKNKLLMYLYEDVLRHKKNGFFVPEVTTFSKLLDMYDSGEDIFAFEIEYIEDN